MPNVNYKIYISVPDLQKTGEEVEQLKQEVDKLKQCGEILSAVIMSLIENLHTFASHIFIYKNTSKNYSVEKLLLVVISMFDRYGGAAEGQGTQ